MNELGVVCAILGFFVLATVFFSVPIEEKWYLTRPSLALLLGILLGP